MSKVIKAIVDSNSSSDPYSRVKLKSTGVWESTGLVNSLNGIPLKKGDCVYVDVSQGYENPFIIGRSMTKDNNFHTKVEGSLIFESSDGKNWTICYVKNNTFVIQNSNEVTLEILEGTIIMNKGKNGGLIKIKELTDKINGLVNWAKDHTHVIPSGAINCGGNVNGAPVTAPAPLSPPDTLNRDDYENTDIKH